MKTRGHLMEDTGKTLFCIRRLLWNQLETSWAGSNGNGTEGDDEDENKEGSSEEDSE